MALMTILDLEGKSVTSYFDSASGIVRLECGRHYEDKEEAAFFADHIPAGSPSGIQFEGVSDYRSSADDHVHVGQLRSALLRAQKCVLRFSEGDSEISFSFVRTTELLSQPNKKNA